MRTLSPSKLWILIFPFPGHLFIFFLYPDLQVTRQDSEAREGWGKGGRPLSYGIQIWNLLTYFPKYCCHHLKAPKGIVEKLENNLDVLDQLHLNNFLGSVSYTSDHLCKTAFPTPDGTVVPS